MGNYLGRCAFQRRHIGLWEVRLIRGHCRCALPVGERQKGGPIALWIRLLRFWLFYILFWLVHTSVVINEELRCAFWTMLQQDPGVLHQIRISQPGIEVPDVIKSVLIVSQILYHDINHKLMLFVLLCKIHCLIIITALTAHADGSLQIKMRAGLYESLQFLEVLQLRITVEKKGGMIYGSLVVIVQFLQVFDQIIYALRVQKFADNLRWFCAINGFEILLHGCIIVSFSVQVIAILS